MDRETLAMHLSAKLGRRDCAKPIGTAHDIRLFRELAVPCGNQIAITTIPLRSYYGTRNFLVDASGCHIAVYDFLVGLDLGPAICSYME